MYPRLNIFIASPLATTNGEWIKLPLETDVLEEKIKSIVGDSDYIIADIDTNLKLRGKISEYSNPYTVNEMFEELEITFYCHINKDISLLSMAISVSDDIDTAIQILKDGNYHYFEGVGNEEELGLAIVEQNFLDIPNELESYIDYESIGIDWSCNGTIIDTDIGCAMQVIYYR